MSDGLFSGAEELMLEAAAEEDSDPLLLVEAFGVLLEKARPLSEAGWYVSGSELLAYALPLYDRAHEALDGAVVKIEAATYADGVEASDAEIIANLGPGEVTRFDGCRWWLADVHVQLRDRLVALQNAQASSGVLIVADGDGGYGFTTMIDLDG